MPFIAIAFGDLLLLLGIIGYVVTGMESWTALIPAFFGLPINILGLAALKADWRKHAMHAAAGLSLLGLLGSGRGLVQLFTLLGGGEVERPGAVISQSIMAVLCFVFLLLCVFSFVNARRQAGRSVEPV
jgi:hypothetical protein